MNITKNIILLDNAFEQNSSGAKATNLAEVIRLGIPVPKGLVLPSHILIEFLQENQLDNSALFIDQIQADLLFQNANEMLLKVKSANIKNNDMKAIILSIKNHIGEKFLIVRSSAIGEDSIEASFAGQLDSVIVNNIETELEHAILVCWASYWHTHNIHYQINRNCYLKGMGIIIQELVDSAISGVVFTGNVAGQKVKDNLIAEFCFGKGDKLVAGTVSPGRIEIARDGSSWDITSLPAEQGSTVSELAHNFSWITTLAQYAVKLEKYFSSPQDIEWTVDRSGKLYILQSRPITTKQPKIYVWSNANMNENYPDPVCPLLGSIAERSYYHYFRNLGRSFGISEKYLKKTEHALSQTVGIQAGRLYYNLTNIYTCIRLMPFSGELIKGWDSFIGIYKNPEKDPDEKSIRMNVISRYKFYLQIIFKTLWTFSFMHLRVEKFIQHVDEHVQLYSKSINFNEGINITELQDAYKSFFTIRFKHWKNAALADAASLITYRLLKKTIESWIPEESSIRQNVLLKGGPKMISVEPSQNLWELAQLIKKTPRLRQLFRHNDMEIINNLNTDKQYSEFNRRFNEYILKWGFRCTGELMLTTSNYQEQPDRLVALLKRYVESSVTEPYDKLDKQIIIFAKEKKKLIHELKKRKSKIPFLIRKCILLIILRMTHKSINFRELVRFKQAHLYSVFRQTILRMGNVMSCLHLIKNDEDIFFLKYTEVQEIFDNLQKQKSENLQFIIDDRKFKQKQFIQMAPPTTIILKEGEIYNPENFAVNNEVINESTAIENYIMGIPASPGKIKGLAAKLSSVFESDKIKSGEILVTKQTDPGWGPVFPLIKGLVLERGGMLSHGAIIAREFGIPAVVDVKGAMNLIDNNQIIMVNGDDGKVSY
ncbi:PEP/pyruvate-binding domain-containing protein [Candidatus Latescibacterota bacterium]